MALKLPELAKIDYTSLDFDSIISLASDLIRNHSDYFVDIDDFQQSNAGRMVVELVAYIVDLLADRVDWRANEATLPTATQKQSVINLLKLINYRMTLPTAASVTVTATITSFVEPFALPERYSIPARDLNGDIINFELLNKNSAGQFIYDTAGGLYEFDTGYEATPILTRNDLVFYEGNSHREFFTMQGINNEFVELSRTSVQEGSVRIWRVTRSPDGKIITRRLLTEVLSFISPEAQTASENGLPPYKLLVTEEDGVFIQFGESTVVEIFDPSGTEEIMIWYRTTSGENGNITARSINYTTTILRGGKNLQISFINNISASGGGASETLEHAKRYGPLTLTTANKTVNPQDFIILLQDLNTILNSITYGKSNEPTLIFNDYGYHIPPYEAWIYPIFKKAGYQSFPTYSYQNSFKIGRPYEMYGPVDTELATFGTYASPTDTFELAKLKLYSMNDDYSNIRVSSLLNKIQYTPGLDFVIDLEGRQINLLAAGAISGGDTVLVQYFENDQTDVPVTINFITSSEQPIPQAPIYTGERTYAYSLDFETIYNENSLSFNDYNYPNGDYYIDYVNNTISVNPSYPRIDTRTSFTIDPKKYILGGINNELILSIDGLNRMAYNSDHDFSIDAYNGWSTAGTGAAVTLANADYYFYVGVDGGELVEYMFPTTGGGVITMRELAFYIYANAVDVATGLVSLNTQGVTVFADASTDPPSQKLTFMSTTPGLGSAIELSAGTTAADLFDVTGLAISESGFGEEIQIKELAHRCRAMLNSLGLCNGFPGQSLEAGETEWPEVFSRGNVVDPLAFELLVGTTDALDITLDGSTNDGVHNILFTTVVAASPYNLSIYQRRLDLVADIQADINAVIGAGVVKVLWLRQTALYARIGFRLIGAIADGASITIVEPAADSARLILNFGDGQSSLDDNLLEAKVSSDSDMVENFFLRFELFGAFGPEALIQIKANNALHNNTINFLGYGVDQYSRGTSIFYDSIIAGNDLISDGGLLYVINAAGPNKNDTFNFEITGAPGLFSDGDYEVVIAAGTYNITTLIAAINTALTTADFSGTPVNISSFIVCEKQEGKNRIRFRLLDFDATASPDLEINDTNIVTGAATVDKLGFELGQKITDASTILLHYAGDWVSDFDSDMSEEASISRYLEDKELICQDYIIKDPKFISFDVKGIVYCSKGFDREIIEEEVKEKIQSNFFIDSREFAENAVLSSVLKEVNSVEGVEHIVVNYFGKDYQLYSKYTNNPRRATITGIKPAENVVDRWNNVSAFKLTLDGTATASTNHDGEYIVVVGAGWTDRDYDSLVENINGGGTLVGLANAIPLTMGKGITDLRAAVQASHSSGIIKFQTTNQGPAVMIKIDNPEKSYTYGYQTLTASADLLDGEYTNSILYDISLEIDGLASGPYDILSPAGGTWYLSDIAEDLNTALGGAAIAAIDEENKIRITSVLGGNNSLIDITAGILPILLGIDLAVPGSSGYISCVGDYTDGTLYVEAPVTEYGAPETPSLIEEEEMYNYMNEIPAKYDEIIYLSDDYYIDGSTEVLDQRHGIMFSFVEVS